MQGPDYRPIDNGKQHQGQPDYLEQVHHHQRLQGLGHLRIDLTVRLRNAHMTDGLLSVRRDDRQRPYLVSRASEAGLSDIDDHPFLIQHLVAIQHLGANQGA